MSRAIGFIIIGGLIPAMAGAQDMRMLRERLERESNVARAGDRARQDYRDPKRRYKTASDTIVIGGGNITVLAAKNIAPVVRDAARQADSALQKMANELPLIGGSIVYVALDSAGMRRRADDEPRAAVMFSAPPHRNPSQSSADLTAEDISRQIEGTAATRVTGLVRSPILVWHHGNLRLRQSDLDLAPSWSAVRFDVLESPSLIGPRCYKGDIVACSMALGLTSVEDPVMSWYDSVTRVSTVRLYRERAARFDAKSTEACLAGSDAACGHTLHVIEALVRPPAGGIARDALLWQAIRMGGDGAIERLLANRGSPSEAIAAVAKVPTDSVVKEWQRQVRTGSQGSEDMSSLIVMVALGWIALLAFLATRITRWR